jgi:hypothetical protein
MMISINPQTSAWAQFILSKRVLLLDCEPSNNSMILACLVAAQVLALSNLELDWGFALW